MDVWLDYLTLERLLSKFREQLYTDCIMVLTPVKLQIGTSVVHWKNT